MDIKNATILNYSFNDIIVTDFYGENKVFPKTWTVAKSPDEIIDNVRLYDRYKIINLPPKKEGVFYIVKDTIAILCWDRDDLLIAVENERSLWPNYFKRLVQVQVLNSNWSA